MNTFFVARIESTARFAAVQISPVGLRRLDRRLDQFGRLDMRINGLEALEVQDNTPIYVLGSSHITQLHATLGLSEEDIDSGFFVRRSDLSLNGALRTTGTLRLMAGAYSWSLSLPQETRRLETAMLLELHVKVLRILNAPAVELRDRFKELVDWAPEEAFEFLGKGLRLPGNSVGPIDIRSHIEPGDVQLLLDHESREIREGTIGLLRSLGSKRPL